MVARLPLRWVRLWLAALRRLWLRRLWLLLLTWSLPILLTFKSLTIESPSHRTRPGLVCC